jgi:hypothetical protein
MGIRGRKPTSALRLITGSHLKDRPPPKNKPMPAGTVERPGNMSKDAAQLWDKFIVRATWLTWADSHKARMWCCLAAEFNRSPGKMNSSRIAQLRILGSELGFDLGSRERLGVQPGGTAAQRDRVHKYI